jgi:Immunity protein Imm1
LTVDTCAAMIVTFYDRQDIRNALNGTLIVDGEHVVALIESLKERPPFFCELVGANDCNLLIGIGGDIGCAQFSCEDGNTPFWIATSPATKAEEGFVDFLMADTPTPVPARYCLPYDAVKDIIVHFVNTGLRNPAADWEQIWTLQDPPLGLPSCPRAC